MEFGTCVDQCTFVSAGVLFDLIEQLVLQVKLNRQTISQSVCIAVEWRETILIRDQASENGKHNGPLHFQRQIIVTFHINSM